MQALAHAPRGAAPLSACRRHVAAHPTVRRAVGIGWLITLSAAQWGCGGLASPIDTGYVGVTGGGPQDVAAVRAEVEAGSLPDLDAFSVEGFLSEHDIPLTPPENAPEIYASIAHAWRMPFGEVAPGVDIFVRLGTTSDTSQHRRRPQNLALVVDRSGSMKYAASAGDYRSKMEAVKQALHNLADRLTDADLVTIVSFSQRATLDLPPTPGGRRDRIRRAIDGLIPLGSTNMYAALDLAFRKVAAAADESRDSRVILFTDALPNVGPSGSADFLQLQRGYAEQGIGFTLMGVGYDYGAGLARDIAQGRGGNAFFLSDADRIAQIFNEEFDYLVSPAAHDLTLQVTIPDGVGIRAVYGVPDYLPGSRGAIVTIPTLFFSPRESGGIIIVRLTLAQTPTFEQPVPMAQLGLSYTLRDGTVREMGMDLVLPAGLAPSGQPPYFSDSAAQRAALLLDTALVFESAARAGRDGRASDGVRMIEDFLKTFDTAALGLSDRTAPTSRGLGDERRLLESLLGTLREMVRWEGYGYSL